MTYARLDDAQRAVLRVLVSGRTIVDLGAGDCGLAADVIELGAASVLAVDSAEPPPVLPPRVSYLRRSFSQYAPFAPFAPVVLLAWPVCYATPGLVETLQRAERVVYVGVNDDVTVCGHASLWTHLLRRPVEVSREGRNDLIVYGPEARLQGDRTGLPHELRAIKALLCCNAGRIIA